MTDYSAYAPPGSIEAEASVPVAPVLPGWRAVLLLAAGLGVFVVATVAAFLLFYSLDSYRGVNLTFLCLPAVFICLALPFVGVAVVRRRQGPGARGGFLVPMAFAANSFVFATTFDLAWVFLLLPYASYSGHAGGATIVVTLTLGWLLSLVVWGYGTVRAEARRRQSRRLAVVVITSGLGMGAIQAGAWAVAYLALGV